ncbi:MAG: hypothetical protein J7L55_05370 [Desulfurococcales archaeon]|nr:hypothetical protein [Desulfurococcales archaeon]
MRGSKVKVAVYKLTSCSGCQLQFLNMEEELLSILDKVEFSYFLEASKEVKPGPYDIGFVEGAVSTEHDVEVVKQARRDCRILVAMGACATAGGIQALRNWGDLEEFKASVYPHPEWIEALKNAEPVSAYVKVDYELRGCPVSKERLLSLMKQLLVGKRPYMRRESLCMECKRKGNVCVIVAKGQPCLGPVTQEGCGALCPSFRRGCYSCFGPSLDPQPERLARLFKERLGMSDEEVKLKFMTFTAWSKPFRKVVSGDGGE